MKKYVVEFIEVSGHTHEFEFVTDNIERSIEQYTRNRSIVGHTILSEGLGGRKQMLFG